MSERPVDSLREQLRQRGYLTHGIERWFALDPWSSRTFWVELAAVAAKAALLIALFGALQMTAVMLFRNAPLSVLEVAFLYASYAPAWFLLASALIIVIALLLKLRPALAIDTPRALLAISLGASVLLTALAAAWWLRFDTPPSAVELAVGVALAVVLLVVGSVVISAALLSFSIYELRRIPAIHQRPRTIPIAAAALLLVAALFVVPFATRPESTAEPMITVEPGTRRVALIAVDGLTDEIFRSRQQLAASFNSSAPLSGLPAASTTERWASVGTGVPTSAHGVRAIEGIRFAGGTHVLQRISRHDVVLSRAAPLVGVARREPLPPTVRRRDYVWELTAGRGLRAVSVNWWASDQLRSDALSSVGPETIFAAAGSDPIRLDAIAFQQFERLVRQNDPRIAVSYFPGLDIILNRVETGRSAQLARSLRALELLERRIEAVRSAGYSVLLVGLPGDGQQGTGILASDATLAVGGTGPVSAWDVAPTLLALLGFPASAEMPGRSLAGEETQPRIATFGSRESRPQSREMNQEYYENLKSLGYIQ